MKKQEVCCATRAADSEWESAGSISECHVRVYVASPGRSSSGAYLSIRHYSYLIHSHRCVLEKAETGQEGQAGPEDA